MSPCPWPSLPAWPPTGLAVRRPGAAPAGHRRHPLARPLLSWPAAALLPGCAPTARHRRHAARALPALKPAKSPGGPSPHSTAAVSPRRPAPGAPPVSSTAPAACLSCTAAGAKAAAPHLLPPVRGVGLGERPSADGRPGRRYVPPSPPFSLWDLSPHRSAPVPRRSAAWHLAPGSSRGPGLGGPPACQAPRAPWVGRVGAPGVPPAQPHARSCCGRGCPGALCSTVLVLRAGGQIWTL